MTKDSRYQNTSRWHPVEQEIKNAINSRQKGMEGQARVCARRAVGKALQIAGLISSPSLPLISKVAEENVLPDEISQLLRSLILKVDENYYLPSEIDLVANAEKIIKFLSSTENANQ